MADESAAQPAASGAAEETENGTVKQDVTQDQESSSSTSVQQETAQDTESKPQVAEQVEVEGEPNTVEGDAGQETGESVDTTEPPQQQVEEPLTPAEPPLTEKELAESRIKQEEHGEDGGEEKEASGQAQETSVSQDTYSEEAGETMGKIENGLSLEEAEDEPVVTIEVTGSDQDEQEVENAEEDKEKGEEKEELLPTQLEGIVEKEDEEEVVIGEEEEEEEEKLDREEAIEMYKDMLAQQEKLTTQNSQLQHRIAEYLARKKTDERSDPGRSVADQQQRYLKCMDTLSQLQLEMTAVEEDFVTEEQQLKQLRQEKQLRVEQARNEFEAYVREKAISAVHSRTGRKLTAQVVNDYLSQLERKDLEVQQVRLENIKLQNKIVQNEALIKKKEQLAEGLHMIDFEQLKINNVDLNEKIEERNEDIMKLRKKVTSTVQVLAHLKEKLQHVQAESNERETKLKEIDEVVAQKRDQLTRLKQTRDAIRNETVKLKHKGGLIGHTALLRDFEERQEQSAAMHDHIHKLQEHYTELTLKCDGLRRRIDQTKTLQNRY